jgi:hypothetical protein
MGDQHEFIYPANPLDQRGGLACEPGNNVTRHGPFARPNFFWISFENPLDPSFLSYPLCEHVYVIADEAGDATKNDEGRGAAPWADVHIGAIRPEGWSVYDLRLGIRELERLRRENEAAMALLVGAVPEGRDAVADLARSTGISNREARRRKRVAHVVAKVDGALEKLANGSVSEEHIAALAPVADMPGASELLDGAESASPEEFANAVEQFRLSASCGDDIAKRQRARRALRFTSGPDGMIGLSGLLPPIEGTELKNRLAAVVDARWRADHPERASVLGGHGGDTHEQRMADALLAMTGVANSSDVGGSSSQDHQDQTTSVDSESREAENRAGGSSWTPKQPTQTDQQNQPIQPCGGFQSDRTDQPDTPRVRDQPDRRDEPEQSDRMEQPGQSDAKGQKQSQQTEPPHRRGQTEPPDQSDQTDQSDRMEQKQSQQMESLHRRGQTESPDQSDQTDQSDRIEQKRQSDGTEQTKQAERAKRTDLTEVVDFLGFALSRASAQSSAPVEPQLSASCDPREGVPSSSPVESLKSPATPTSITASAAPITVVKTAKPAVVIVFDVDRWQARLAGGRPIPITESLLDMARNDLYYCFKNTAGEVLKFARSRRDPTPVQRLALVVRDERCVYPGCHAPPEACDAHHTNEVVKDLGLTNVEVMALFCKAHHRHIHLNDLVVIREPDSNITIKRRNTGVIVTQTPQQRRAA